MTIDLGYRALLLRFADCGVVDLEIPQGIGGLAAAITGTVDKDARASVAGFKPGRSLRLCVFEARNGGDATDHRLVETAQLLAQAATEACRVTDISTPHVLHLAGNSERLQASSHMSLLEIAVTSGEEDDTWELMSEAIESGLCGSNVADADLRIVLKQPSRLVLVEAWSSPRACQRFAHHVLGGILAQLDISPQHTAWALLRKASATLALPAPISI
ncbi:MAG TPA: hypothetical protein VLI05_04680 [Candidatus Saccharimonadia bacterium]|nr:hypothetical protein [Candidatus Saccharimonadia bacterium]